MRHHPDKKSRSSDTFRKLHKVGVSVSSTPSAESTELRYSFPEFKSPVIVSTMPTSESDKLTLESLNERLTALERKFDTSQFADNISRLGDLLSLAALGKEPTKNVEKKTNCSESSTSVLTFLSAADSATLTKKKKRCRFFPNCREGSKCTYFHPNKRCANFPHCIYGASCLFLHPYCPRGVICGRIDCPYTHYAVVQTSESDSEGSALEVVKEEDEEKNYGKLAKSRVADGKTTDRFKAYRKDLYPSNSGSSQDDYVASSSAAAVPRHGERKEKKGPAKSVPNKSTALQNSSHSFTFRHRESPETAPLGRSGRVGCIERISADPAL